MSSAWWMIPIAVAFVMTSCSPTGYEERVEYLILATVDTFDVPDSARSDRVAIRVAGYVGGTTAYSFERILHQQRDSLVEMAVYGRMVQKTGARYEIKDITFDTTFVLAISPARIGWQYFRLFAANGTFNDSTRLY